MKDKEIRVPINEGFTPLEKGHLPKEPSNFGYTPATSKVTAPLPSGGSAVAPPPPKKD